MLDVGVDNWRDHGNGIGACDVGGANGGNVINEDAFILSCPTDLSVSHR
jgi:hypothetical protein